MRRLALVLCRFAELLGDILRRLVNDSSHDVCLEIAKQMRMISQELAGIDAAVMSQYALL